MLAESDKKEFLLRIRRLEKFQRCLFSFADFIGHTAAEIQYDADGNRNLFGRESDDPLFDVVFEDPEIAGFETSNKTILRAGDRDVDECELHVHTERLAGLD